MHPIRRIFILLFVLPALACSLPLRAGYNISSLPQNIVKQPILIQAPANSTATPTPFQPLGPTSTYIPTGSPTPVPSSTAIPTNTAKPTKIWNDFPGPTVDPDMPIPAPVGLLSHPEGQVNILLLGSDQRPNDGGFRTDTILLLTLSPSEGTVHLTSFPRDLYVYIPGWTINRVNTAFPHGGFSTMAQTFEYNFGVRPDHYVLINFWSFEEVIDQLGGVNVNVAVPLTDHRDGHGNYTVHAGVVHMDGETALWYVRSRYSSSDFERTRRQQEVVQAVFDKLISLNAITRAPQLYKIYRNSVTTDLSLEDITSLLPLATKIGDSSNIKQFFISREEVTAWRNTSGAQVLVPIREKVLDVMRQALSSSDNQGN